MCLVSHSCPTLCSPIDCSLPGSSVHGDSPGQNTGMSCHALLQGILPTQGSNPGLPHCRCIPYWRNHQESPSGQVRSGQSLSRVRLFATPWITARQHPCPSPTPGVHSDSRPSSQWCHPAIWSSVVPFSSCPQSLPASETFPMSQLFAWGGQSTGVSAWASFLPKKSQGWSPSEWTDWISLQSKGLSRVFSNTTVQKHKFFSAQLSSQSNSYIHTWPLEKP